MKLYICRHGETVENEKGIIQGWLGGSLNEAGKEQANALGPKIETVHPNIIFISDLQRCIETYQHVIMASPSLKSVRTLYDWRIRERSFGRLEGDESAGVDWASFWSRPENDQEYGQESNMKVRQRVARFVDDLALITSNQMTVVIITHGGIVNVLKAFEEGSSYEPKKYPNAELIQIDYDALVVGSRKWTNEKMSSQTDTPLHI